MPGAGSITTGTAGITPTCNGGQIGIRWKRAEVLISTSLSATTQFPILTRMGFARLARIARVRIHVVGLANPRVGFQTRVEEELAPVSPHAAYPTTLLHHPQLHSYLHLHNHPVHSNQHSRNRPQHSHIRPLVQIGLQGSGNPAILSRAPLPDLSSTIHPSSDHQPTKTMV